MASKLVKIIDLGPAKKYDLMEVFVDLKDLGDSGDDSWIKSTLNIKHLILGKVVDPGFRQHIKTDDNDNNIMNKLCISSIENKSTWQVI